MALKLRPFFIITAVLIVASLLLIGCAPQNTGTPGPNGTQQNTGLRGMNDSRFNNRTNMQGNLMQNNNRNGYYTTDQNGMVNRMGANNQIGNNGAIDRNLPQNNNNLNGRDRNLNDNDTDNGMDDLNGDRINNRAGLLNGTDANNLGQTTANNNTRAENIKKQLVSMPEVDDANCLVSGNTVIVGYRPSNNSRDVNATKNKIINMVKQIDKNADTVAVSESGDIMNQIQNLTNDIANKPMSEINQEIRQLLQKINPVTG